MAIESRLTGGDHARAEEYLGKLHPEDRANVEKVVRVVDLLANGFERDSWGGERGKSALFGAYAIGGWLDKEPPRPDVDLLVFTNARWEDTGYIHPPADWPYEWVYTRQDEFIGMVAGHFRATGFEVEMPDPEEIPDEYSRGINPRMMMRLGPPEGNPCSPLDIVYISAGYSKPRIDSFEEFYEQDVTPEGRPMGRVALHESVVTIPPIQYRL